MKKTIIAIIILAIAGVLFWAFKSETNIPATETINTPIIQNQAIGDEITTINEEIESIDVGNTDKEFDDVNKDLQGL
ncbi:MAG: hypothetical protein UT90_C0020G0014 [Parcubacteria group bacterium GW2011_GWA1_40_21]|nr:MAG: hypothetical protein UT90_C0020G0014 [Parcubacteria group bacterium GW2011_GWA1_40_21]